MECPQCHQKRCLSPYIDTEGKIQFPSFVGRCNHEHRCGYHYTPKQYFHDNPDAKEGLMDNYQTPKFSKPVPPKPKVEPYYFPFEILKKTENRYQENHLFQYLKSIFGPIQAQKMMRGYHVGTAKLWDGATVFWQVDIEDRVRDAKIMYYDALTGHRAKDEQHHVTWLHSLQHIDKERITQCFFGEHLIKEEPDKPIAVVESEKTAVICSGYIPEYVWIATGGKDGMFSKANLDILKGHRVVLFPDLGQYDNWLHKAAELKVHGIDALCNGNLEKNASEEERAEGLDIADYLVQEDPRRMLLASIIQANPAIGLLVDRLKLEIV